MDNTLVDNKSRSAAPRTQARARPRLFSGRQGKRLREALLAYAFLSPALLIIGAFGLFPLLFAALQSSYSGLNRVVGTYNGIGNYVRALDGLAYVLFFWIAIGLVVMAVRIVRGARQNAIERKQSSVWVWALPGALIGAGIAGFVLFIYRFLPLLLLIPNEMRGRNNTNEVFRRLVGEAWWSAEVQIAFWPSLALIVGGIALMIAVGRRLPATTQPQNHTGAFISATVMVLFAGFLTWITWTEIDDAYAAAQETGEALGLWTQILTISVGFLLLWIAWRVWESASKTNSNGGMMLRLGAAAMVLVAAWFLIGELPRALAAGDDEWWYGILATFYYSLGTVPVQLGVALGLAVLLFQNIRGKELFRVLYFVPYIAPFVGTAAVFRILFSSRPNAPVNAVMRALGLDPLRWRDEPMGVLQMLLGSGISLPEWAVGPSLSLVVIMIYGVWSYIGFNAVVFMAGLGAIPRELYEASAIDGAGRWAQFRSITLPLLSPTIYFLTLYSVIGTFKAFNHIYVMRSAAALGTTDTASIVIFQAFRRDTRFGYAAALAIVLLIIILGLTAVNNRIARERVFYG